jgi:hypothetical protein
MRLPNAENAWVEVAKARDYLLAIDHREGGGKAGFFVGFGFFQEQWENLADALLGHGAGNDVARVIETPYGTKFVIEGILETPDGRNPRVRSVWLIDIGTDKPRLVTAYPLER